MTSLSLPFTPGFRIALVDESRLDDEVRRFRLYVVRFSKGRHVQAERLRRLQARLRPDRVTVARRVGVSDGEERATARRA